MKKTRNSYSQLQRLIASVALGSFSVTFLVPATYAEASQDAARAASYDVLPILPMSPDAALTGGLPAFDGEDDLILGAGTESDRFYAHHLPDPVNAKNANMFLPQIDLLIPGPGAFDLRVARTYNSRSNYNGPFGHGWSFNYDIRVQADDHGDLRVTDPDGFVSTFSKAGLKSELVRARIARSIVDGMRGDNESRGQQHDDEFYERQEEKLRIDEGYFDDNRDKYATGMKASDGIFWSVDRGVQRISQGNGGWIRTMPDGTQQHFDAKLGKLTKAIDRNGNFVKMSYDEGGRLQSVADRAGRALRFTFEGNGRITKVQDAVGRAINYRYDAAGNLVGSSDPMGAATSYAYDAEHNMTKVTWPGGASTVTRYDTAKDWVLAQAGPGAKRTTYEYGGDANDPQKLRTTIVDSLGAKTVYEYDDSENAVSKIDPLGNRTSVWYSNCCGKPVKEIDPLGNTTEYAYNPYGDLIGIKDANGLVTKVSYEEKFGLVRSRTTPDGAILKIAYDARGNATEVVGPTGQKRAFAYDAAGNVSQVTESNGAVTKLTYDDAGNPATITDPEGGVVKTKYDRVGRLQTMTDARGGLTRYQFDAANRLIKTVDSAGRTSVMKYDVAGHRVETVDPRGAVTKFKYNDLGQMTEVARADGSKLSYAFDALGNVRKVTGPNGGAWSYRYDAAGRMVAASDPLNAETKYEFDGANRLTAVLRANGARQSYEYDPIGRLVAAVDPAKGRARFTYDPMGKLTSVTNQLGATSRFEYDKAGRIAKIVDATDKARSFTYDAVGKRSSYTDEKGKVVTYGWDKNGRLNKVGDAQGERRWAFDKGGMMTSYAETIGGTTKTLAMTYDAAGRLTTMKGPNGGTVTRTYDGLANLASVTDPKGKKTAFVYDKLGRLTQMSDSKLDTTTFSYDKAGNLTAMTDPAGSVTKHEYDLAGRRIATTLNSATTRFTYDAMGNTTSVLAADGGRTTMAYDSMSRLSTLTTPGGASTASYQYDAGGQLVAAPLTGGGRATMSYDRAGRLATLNGRSIMDPRASALDGGSHGVTASGSSHAVGGNLSGPRNGRGGPSAPMVALPNAATAAPGAGSGPGAGIPRDGAVGRDTGRNAGTVGAFPMDANGGVSPMPGGGAPQPGGGSSSGATSGGGIGGSIADALGGITVTPNPDGTFNVGLPVGDGGAGVYLTVGPNGIQGGGVNYSFPMPGGSVGTVGLGYDRTNGLTFGGGVQLPGGLGNVNVSIAQNGTVMAGGNLAIPLGNGGSLILSPGVVWGPDGLEWGGGVGLDIPGIGTFNFGFDENELRFADTTFSVPLPGGGLLEMNGLVVNGVDGLELTGSGSVTMAGGLGSMQFVYGSIDGEPFFRSMGSIAIPQEGGGFIDVPLNFDFGPGGLSFANGGGGLAIPLGNGNFLTVNGTMANGVPMIGLNDFCITCLLFSML